MFYCYIFTSSWQLMMHQHVQKVPEYKQINIHGHICRKCLNHMYMKFIKIELFYIDYSILYIKVFIYIYYITIIFHP